MHVLHVFLLSVWLLLAEGAAPVFSPTVYTATIGINTTAGTTLATVAYTFSDANEVVTLSSDPTSDGYSYFGFSGLNLILANRLDVEYGFTPWSVRILAIDNGTTPETGTATLSLTMYDSTTTTTTTPAPPGYSWFDQKENVILFGSFFGFIALLTASCILMCFRFHRIGTCLPRSCPEYRQCRASARRQCTCCPLPCTFIEHERMETEDTFDYDERGTTSYLSRRTSVADIVAPPTSSMCSSKKKKIVSAGSSETKEKKGPPPVRSVTPISIGNVDYREAGFDGMRSPGFNAPIFTSYGGSSGVSSTSNKKKQKRKF